MIEIEEAAFILKIPTKIASANHIAFIQAIFRHREFLVKEALSEGHASAGPDAQKRFPRRATPFDKLKECRPSRPRHGESARGGLEA